MAIACWSVKGGSGTTVVATCLSIVLSRLVPVGGVLVDVTGEASTALGLPEDTGPGIGDWIAAGDDVPLDAFDRLGVSATPRLRVIGPGHLPEHLSTQDVARIASQVCHRDNVIIDCGSARDPVGLVMARESSRSLLILRACYLALRRSTQCELRPSGVVLVKEPGRALRTRDIEDVLGVAVSAEIEYDPAVGRAVDVGLLGKRLPRQLENSMRQLLI